jgi:hypothetical protein
MMDHSLSFEQKQDCVDLLKKAQAPSVFQDADFDVAFHDDWLTGFMEAEASCCLQNQNIRVVCSFVITQKRDKGRQAEAIRKRFHIPSSVQFKSSYTHL